jgi:hypothetical protein
MTRILPWTGVALMLAIAACAPKSESPRAKSQRERDSVLGASRLPGAQGVRGALGASDSAAARNARIDSVAGER